MNSDIPVPAECLVHGGSNIEDLENFWSIGRGWGISRNDPTPHALSHGLFQAMFPISAPTDNPLDFFADSPTSRQCSSVSQTVCYLL